MALGDPFQILLILGMVPLIPALIVYWIVRLTHRHELKPTKIQSIDRKNQLQTLSQLVLITLQVVVTFAVQYSIYSSGVSIV